MNQRDFGKWLLITIVFWVPLSLVLLIGIDRAESYRRSCHADLLQESMRFDLELIQRAYQPSMLLSLPWDEIRAVQSHAHESETWRQAVAADLTRAGLRPHLLLVWSPKNDRLVPGGAISDAFRPFLQILRNRQNQMLEKSRTVISFEGGELPIHLALRMTRRHRFYPMQALGKKWWLAHGPVNSADRGQAYYLLLIDQANIVTEQLQPLWHKRLQRFLRHRLSDTAASHPDRQARDHQSFDGLESVGERFFSADREQVLAGIRFPRAEFSVVQEFPWSLRLWGSLARFAWIAFSFAFLVGSYRFWVCGIGNEYLTVGNRIRLHLAAAVGLPLVGIILMGEFQMNAGLSSLLATGQEKIAQDLERMEDQLERSVYRLETRMRRVAEQMPPIFSREQAEHWCFNILEGQYPISNAHLLSSEGVYLLPQHCQNKPGFLYMTLMSKPRRNWFLHRFFERGGYLEPYYEELLRTYAPDGQPMSGSALKNLIRTKNRQRPVNAVTDSVWEKAMGGLARDTCRRYNQRAGLIQMQSGEDGKGDAIGMMAAVAGIEHEDLVNESMQHLGHIRRFNTGKETVFDLAFLLRDRDGRAHNLLLLHWRNEALTFPFAHAITRHAKRHPQFGGRYIFCDDHDALDFASTPVPKGMRFTASALRLPGESQHFIGCMPGGEWRLFQFRRCRELDHLIIGCSMPLSQLFNGITPMRYRFVAGTSGVVALVALLLFMLSRLLVKPLERIEQSVAQLSKPGDVLIEVPNQVGEILSLVRLFTDVKEGLKQLDVARLVQEDLLPHGILEHHGLRVTGSSIMMEQVGGDFFDFVVDPRDQRFLYVGIGDVTGHGLPAAIVVAMISSAVRLLARTGRVAPEELLSAMNPHLVRILKRLRMTSFQLVRINGDTGEFQFSSGGHPPMLQLKPGQPPISWEMAAFPLGSNKKTRYQGRTGTMESGDCLVFCTDGSIEAVTPSGREVGYQGFARLAAHECQAGFSGVMDRLFERFRTTTGSNAWNDDVTMVVLAFEKPPVVVHETKNTESIS